MQFIIGNKTKKVNMAIIIYNIDFFTVGLVIIVFSLFLLKNKKTPNIVKYIAKLKIK